MDKEYNIKAADVVIDRNQCLGAGSFGAVYKGTWSGTDVAIKVLLCKSLNKEAQAEFMHELNLMTSLRSPKLMQVFGGILETGKQAIVMELSPKGSLYDLLQDEPTLGWHIKCRIGMDIAYGLKYLHERKIIHRDLKSPNVLMDRELNAKICDFGLAKVKTQSSVMSTMASSVGTILWMAPELFGRKVTHTSAADVYALGMVLYELLTHKVPFADDLVGRRAPDVIPGWLTAGERPDLPEIGTAEFKDLIGQCWQQDVAARPQAAVVAQILEQMKNVANVSGAAPQSTPSVFDANIKDAGREAFLPQSTADVRQRPAQAKKIGARDAELALSTADVRQRPVRAEELAPRVANMMLSTAAIKPVVSQVAQEQVDKLVTLVMDGEETKAEALIKENPAILLQKGTGKDPAGRTFENITAFQYALWSLDWYMWEMMLPHMDTSEAREQYDALMSRRTRHGTQFDFGPLITALQTYIDKYDGWSGNQCRAHWGNVVGGAQRQLPMHVVQEYCRTDRPFKPRPNFSKGTRGREFKVSMYYGGTWHDDQVFKRSHWFPTAGVREEWDGEEKSGWPRVGGWVMPAYRVVRAGEGGGGEGDWTVPGGAFVGRPSRSRAGDTMRDRAAIDDLSTVRKDQLRALGESLSQSFDRKL